jgi:hypothetical protein
VRRWYLISKALLDYSIRKESVAGAGHVPRMALSVSLIVIVRVCKSHGRPGSGWKRERGSDYIH